MDLAVSHSKALRLFWWKGVPNFGDALSQIVVAHVSRREVAHSGAVGADLFAVGSILQIVRRRFTEGRKRRPVIWGSGLLHPTPRDFLPHVDFALLRGPITASLLGLKPAGFGDPGLLIAKALGQAPERTDKIGLVPHYKQVDDPAIQALADADPRIQLIDVRDDAAAVCGQIASCAHVFASSLHGLITADAYGVASTWADPGEESHLKYHDYAASVGRPMVNPVTWGEIPELLATLKSPADLPWADGVARAQSDLLNSFPAQLCAPTHAGAA